VFQDARLFPHLTVATNLGYGRWFAPKRERYVDPDQVIDLLGLGALLGRRPGDLSGGDSQRTAICRALLNAPAVLLADEPTGSLDEATGDSVFALLRSLAQHDRITIILATHERRFAEACDRIVRVRDGRLLANL